MTEPDAPGAPTAASLAPRPDLAQRWPAWLRLLLISFLTLYFELLILRWLPTEIRVLAYFSNFTLTSCVLGLGLGAVISQQPFRPSAFGFWLAGLMAIALFYRGFDIQLPLTSHRDFIWGGLSTQARGTAV